jgi:uncharacterized protein
MSFPSAGLATLSEQLESKCVGLLKDATTMTLATCANNIPWATDVYFVSAGFDLWFISSPRSRHGAILKQNPSCAATIHPSARDWKEIRGLQLAGTATEFDPICNPEPLFRYFEKFPFAQSIYTNLSAGSDAARLSIYQLAAEKAWYMDNSIGFGAKFVCEIKNGNRIGNFNKL